MIKVIKLLILKSLIYSLINIIQSNSKTPEFCASRVRNFYKESYQKIKDITEEEFKQHLNARINAVNKKEYSLRYFIPPR